MQVDLDSSNVHDPKVPLGYASEIKDLFRDRDVRAMLKFGFDLSLYEDVHSRADQILQRLEAGDMPCDGAWSPQDVEKFRKWIADGKLP